MLKSKRANITIILLVLLCLSLGVLGLSKFFDSAQASVSSAIDSRFQNPDIALSVALDPAAKWEKYENTKYGYIVKYPKQWPAASSKQEFGDLDTYTRFLSNRIKLTISVANSHEYSQNARPMTFGNNTFYISPHQEDLRIATIEHNNLFYTLKLSQRNYFANDKEFSATFQNVLKSLEFTK